MARERGHEVQIVGNFFLEEKKNFPFSFLFFFLSHASCTSWTSWIARVIFACKYKVTRVIDKFHYAENESNIRK